MFLLTYGGINTKESDQGGVFALLQRVHSILDEELGNLHAGGDCTNDPQQTGMTSDISKGEEGSCGTLSQVDETCHSRLGGKIVFIYPFAFDWIKFLHLDLSKLIYVVCDDIYIFTHFQV